MNGLKIKFSDRIQIPHRYTQKIHTFWIGLHVKGLKFSRVWYPDGKLATNFTEDPGPYLFTRWSGMKTHFEYCSPRENWVTMFDFDALEVGNGSHSLILNWNNHRYELPKDVLIPKNMLPVCRSRFREMTQKYHSGLPEDILCAELMLFSLLEILISSKKAPKTTNPAEKLKKMIDEDGNFKHNISELSEICGFSKDYLRLMFQKTYHISPKEYQNNKRMTSVVELITMTNIPLKEIAFSSGLKNVTHLNSLIKKKYDLTPKELRSLQIK